MGKEKTFMKITNKDIYDEIKAMKKKNEEQHNIVVAHQITTNGKVKLNTWRSITALTLTITLLLALVSYMVKG